MTALAHRPPLTPTAATLVALIGPSAVGKSTVVRALLAHDVTVLASWTTRPPRAGESDGIDHHFVDEASFERMRARGAFAQVVQPFGLAARYGLPVVEPRPGSVSLVVLRAPLVPLLRRLHPAARVYQIEDDAATCRRRLLARQEAGEPVGERLDGWAGELMLGRQQCDRRFVNGGDAPLLAHRILEAAVSDDRCGAPR